MMRSVLLKCFFAGLFLLCTLSAVADKTDLQTAQKIACQFFNDQNSAHSRSFVSRNLTQKQLPTDSVYLFINGNGNFVLVSGRDDLPTVLGYGEYQDEEPHESLLNLTKMMGTGVNQFFNESATASVAPLLKTVRHQDAPFNGSCPYYLELGKPVSEKRCKVGCVATALEEILTYYQYPNRLQDDLYGWSTAHYHIDTIPKGTKLNFSQILDKYETGQYTDNQAAAVANLCYYCGVAAKMNWGITASGANASHLVAPLKKAFGYKYVRHLYATDYTPQRWRELIDKELEGGRPVWFAGCTYLIDGHAFAIDGKDDNGFYHVHWGYGGNYDGYYDLSILNTFENPYRPTETGKWMGQYCNQEMLLLSPDSVAWSDGDTIRLKDNLKIDSVKYLRNPDGNKYVTLKIYARNISDEPINTVVELLTYAIGDTAIFKNADYVGITGANIEAHQSVCMSAFCHFSNSGQRVFGISADGIKFLYKDTLQILPSTELGVSVLSVDTVMHGTEAIFHVHINNNSNTAWAGDIITFSMFEGDYTTSEGDWRQWKVMNLAPAATETDTISFGQLKTNTKYTFVVRNPWLPAFTMIFNTGQNVSGISPLKSAEREGTSYMLNGMPINGKKQKGIYLEQKNGHYIKVYRNK